MTDTAGAMTDTAGAMTDTALSDVQLRRTAQHTGRVTEGCMEVFMEVGLGEVLGMSSEDLKQLARRVEALEGKIILCKIWLLHYRVPCTKTKKNWINCRK
jgi:hypothetical protein